MASYSHNTSNGEGIGPPQAKGALKAVTHRSCVWARQAATGVNGAGIIDGEPGKLSRVPPGHAVAIYGSYWDSIGAVALGGWVRWTTHPEYWRCALRPSESGTFCLFLNAGEHH